jgi:hypothetical protein
MKKLSVVLIAIFSLISAGLAQTGTDVFKQTIDLRATPHGDEYGIQAKAAIAQRDNVQSFAVICGSNVEDGTRYQVWVTNSEGTFRVGTMTMFEKKGRLLLLSSEDPLSEAFPVTDLQAVMIRDLEGVLAEGVF